MAPLSTSRQRLGSVRPAEPRDAEAIGSLIVQMWRLEMPEVLAAGERATAAFVARHLLADGGQRLQGLVVAEGEGRVVAVGGLATAAAPRASFYRRGVVRDIRQLGGTVALVKLVRPIIRNTAAIVPEKDPGVGYIHSVVVDAGARGRGAGARIVTALEASAVRGGCHRAVVQVLIPEAVEFWSRMGYGEYAQLPVSRIRRWLATDSVLMRKPLHERAQDGRESGEPVS